jgi:hypothetical protein
MPLPRPSVASPCCRARPRTSVRRHVRRLDSEIPPLDRLPARAPLHARRRSLSLGA